MEVLEVAEVYLQETYCKSDSPVFLLSPSHIHNKALNVRNITRIITSSAFSHIT